MYGVKNIKNPDRTFEKILEEKIHRKMGIKIYIEDFLREKFY